jgi:hypothetical protein
VLGLASWHTPQRCTSAEFWKEHAARDERNTQLLGRDGRYHSYDDLLADADPTLVGELEAPVWKDKFDRAQAAVGALAWHLEETGPDVVVIVGDQHELFGTDGVPAIGLFTGECLWDLPPDAERQLRRVRRVHESARRRRRGGDHRRSRTRIECQSPCQRGRSDGYQASSPIHGFAGRHGYRSGDRARGPLTGSGRFRCGRQCWPRRSR